MPNDFAIIMNNERVSANKKTKTKTITKPKRYYPSWGRITDFFCSFKCESGESKSISNHRYQRSLNIAYSASQRKKNSKPSHQMYGPRTKS